jgi:hypothetical protein
MTSSSRKEKTAQRAVSTAAAGIQLDIGCGAQKQPGYVGMDKRALPGVDVVHDWNVYPWPFPDESVLRVVAAHVVEHVSPIDGNFIRWMDEVWRICKPDAQVAIVTPHGLSVGYMADPTHCNPCNEVTWSYFDPLDPRDAYKHYRPWPWAIQMLTWSPEANIEVLLVKRRDDKSYHEG